MRKFYRTSAGKLTFRTQNDTDSANFRSARDTNNIFCSLYTESVC